jgi:hypothetical protein
MINDYNYKGSIICHFSFVISHLFSLLSLDFRLKLMCPYMIEKGITIRIATNRIKGAAVRDKNPFTGGWDIAIYPNTIRIKPMTRICRFFLPKGITSGAFLFCRCCWAIVPLLLSKGVLKRIRNLKVQFLQFKLLVYLFNTRVRCLGSRTISRGGAAILDDKSISRSLPAHRRGGAAD